MKYFILVSGLMVAIAAEAHLLFKPHVAGNADDSSCKESTLAPARSIPGRDSDLEVPHSRADPARSAGERRDGEIAVTNILEDTEYGKLRDAIRADPRLFMESARRIRRLERVENRRQLASLLIRIFGVMPAIERAAALPVVLEVPGLISSEVTEDRYLWSAIARAYEDPAVKSALLRVAQFDRDELVRAMALDSCGTFGSDERFGTVLLAAAEIGTVTCQISALRGLGDVTSPAALAELDAATSGERRDVRHACYEALARRARWDELAMESISRVVNRTMERGDAQFLWQELCRRSVASRLRREDLARLEALTRAPK